MSNFVLQAKNLTKSYDNENIKALRGVDVDITAGEFVAISGHSGSGKSTLLQLLGGLDRPTSGEILFKGESLSDGYDLDAYRSQHIGFVFQAFYLLPTLTALENVQIPMFEGTLGPRERREKAKKLLLELGLGHRLDQYPNQLSAGERQRVAIARALANDPEILLADEPTGNLDSENSAKIMSILTGIQTSRNMTLIVVTHEGDIAKNAPRNIKIRDGKIIS